jgi:Dolichyl-phosphate-mannose-protein mannosyltransferase
MSTSDGVQASSPGAPALRRLRRPSPARAPGSVATRIGVSRWTRYGWGAIATTVAFIAMTCWWLSQDHSIPIYDAGNHLEIAFRFREMIQSGNLLGPFNYESVYPPLAHLVGTLGAFVGGVNVPAPIIAENLIFAPLLALGCYRIGRLLFGSAAGMLAVIFVFGSPLLIEQLHVFMLDTPMTALIAVTIWLLLASEDFSRVELAAFAGLAAGLGMSIKVQFALYVAALVLLMLLRGGWRNRRGLVAFVLVAVVIGAPWYIDHISELGLMLEVASPTGGGPGVVPPPPGNAPPTLSTANLLWYFWSVLNSQVLAPLFLLAVGGTLWSAVTLARQRKAQPARLEFFLAGLLTWSIITLTPHHDVRYGLPLLVFVAVIGTGWIVCLPRAPRLAAIAVLALGVTANTLGVSIGVGKEATVALAGQLPSTAQLPDRVIFYATKGFLAAGPIEDGNVPGLLDALHRDGVQRVAWSLEQSRLPDFSFEGLAPLARIAGLQIAILSGLEFSRSPSTATLIHEPVTTRAQPTCTRVADGTGVWVVRYDLAAQKLALYCPTRNPRFYDVGGVR